MCIRDSYQILRKLSAGNLVRVSRGALGGCELSCDLDATSLYAVSYTHLDVYKRQVPHLLDGIRPAIAPCDLPGLHIAGCVKIRVHRCV